MEGLSFTSKGAILGADYFKNSRLCLSQRRFGEALRDVYGALKENDFLKKRSIFSGREQLVGEVSRIFVSPTLRPSLWYFPITWVGGEKQLMGLEEVPLKIERNNPSFLFEFLLDSDVRNTYSPFFLYLPPRFYLEKQPTQPTGPTE